MKQIKLLPFADLHNCKEYADKCYDILNFVGEKALQIKPDFITISGDINNNAILNSDSHYLPRFKTKLDLISGIAPIVMIYGTYTHDAPGSLEIFRNDKTIFIVRPGKPLIIKDTIFYCVPDYRVTDSEKTNHTTAGQDMNQYLQNLCFAYGAHRKAYPDFPAIVLGHGNVKSITTEKHEAVKRSTIYLTEKTLAEIQANVVLYGHIHQRMVFADIPGGYLGGMAHDWKDLDYKPAIYEILLINNKAIIQAHEIPFIPRRQKIDRYIPNPIPTNEFDGDIIWLEKKKGDPGTKEDLIKAGAHPDSKVTIKPEVKTVIRNKDIHKISGYRELYKAYRPDASEAELLICDEIEKIEIKEGRLSEKKTIIPISTHIQGLKQLLNGIGKEEIYIDWSKHNGTLGLLAPGGMGKSAIVMCIPPHSVCITQGNPIASMFIDGGFIIQEWKVNDQIITTERFFKVTEKKTDTAYKVLINGKPIDFASGSLSAYDNYINFNFGSPRMFALTVLRSQFSNPSTWNKVPINPDIFLMNNSEFKSIITELTNCSKDFAWKYCNDNLQELIIKQTDIESEIKGLADNIENPELIKEIIDKIQPDLNSSTLIITGKQIELDSAKELINTLNIEFTESEKARQAMQLYDDQLTANNSKLTELEVLKNKKPTITEEEIKKNILCLEQQRIKQEEIKKRNDEKQKEYNLRLIDYSAIVKNYASKHTEYVTEKSRKENANNKRHNLICEVATEIEYLQKTNEALNKACPNCGYVDPENKKKIDENNESINTKTEILNREKDLFSKIEKEISEFLFTLEKPQSPMEPIYEDMNTTVQAFLDTENKRLSDYQLMMEKIKGAAVEWGKIAKENEDIRVKHFAESSKVKINLAQIVQEKKAKIENLEKEIKNLESVKSGYQADLKSLTDKLADIESKKNKLFALERALEIIKSEYVKWDRLTTAWHRDGIPAMILENIAPEIDQGVNDLLMIYYPKIMIQTETINQYTNKKEFYENYHIDIINLITGFRAPFNSPSGMEKDFLIGIFREVCRNIYERTSNVIYLLGIDDEPDAWVSEEKITDFWNMKKQLDEGKGRLRICICHSPSAKIVFEQSIDLLSM